MNSPRLPFRFAFTAFANGFAVLVVEVIGARMLKSVFGAGAFVWAGVLSVTLLALAVGYWFGGRCADRGDKRAYLAMSLVACGAAVLVTLALRASVFDWTRGLDLRTAILISSTACLFAPLTCLGMVSPLLIERAARQSGEIGRSVGRIYGISTVGSVVGALVTVFVLIGRLAVDDILVGISWFVVVLGIGWCIVDRWRLGIGIGVLTLCVSATLLDSPVAFHACCGGVVHDEESFFGTIQVVDFAQPFDGERRDARVLVVDGREQSILSRCGTKSWHSFSDDFHLACAFRPRASSALVVGLGSGFLMRSLAARGLRVEAVELDPRVHAVACEYFGHDDSHGVVHLEDGRRFLERTTRRFDLVFVNAFHADGAAGHLMTREAIAAARRVLTPGGIVAYNFLGFIAGDAARATRAMAKTLGTEFAQVDAYSRFRGAGYGDILFFASDSNMELQPVGALAPCFSDEQSRALRTLYQTGVVWLEIAQADVFTDDFMPIDVWLAESSVRWHASSAAAPWTEVLAADRR